jgi:spore coat polysaccharide biosynthesis predicted glycosyltransferase SpsG
MPARVVVRADAVATTGAGHLARVLGLVDELRARGAEVVVAGEVEIPWVLDLLAERGLGPVAFPSAPLSFARWCRDEGALAVVLDGYDFDPGLGSALMAGGLRVLSMRDGRFGAEQACDVAVDQNLGSERRARPHEGTLLAGPRYTLFRDEVLSATPVTWAPDHRGSRVLAFFGGSDPFGAAEVVAPLVLDAVAPLDLRVVTADRGVADRLGSLPAAPGQGVTVLAPRPDLTSLARGADLVVTATGSSVWELMVHGVAFACVRVADNQELGYRALLTRGLCLGLGSLDDLRDDPGTAARARTEIRRLSADTLLRATLAGRGRSLFDGHGRARVADEFLPQTRESSQDRADPRRRNQGAP